MHISVVIPLYNKKDSIVRALDSVLNQNVLPDEIIIVDDGSSDGSGKIVELLIHPLVRLINQKNQGVSAARNTGIDAAKYEWIAFLDADDIWKPDYLKEISDLARSYPECSVLATAYELQDSSGHRSSIILNKIPFEENSGLLTNYFEVASCSNPPLCSSAIVVKKAALQVLGGFPIGIESGEDLLTWARLAVKFSIGYCLNASSIFIQGPEHIFSDKPSRIPEKLDFVGFELMRLYKLHPNTYKLKNYISFWKKMRASDYLRLGMKKHVIKESFEALKINPSSKIMCLYIIMTIFPIKFVNLIYKKYNEFLKS